MSTLEIWLLALGLAMDCFAVSIATGLGVRRFLPAPMLLMALSFGVFQAAMPFIGWACASSFSRLVEQVDHWLAFAILAFLGGRMVRDSFREGDDHSGFDPTRPRVVLSLSVATSIDALAVGVSFAFLGIQGVGGILRPIAIIGLVSLLMSLIGLGIGIYAGQGIARRLRAELVGGIILILIGLKILVEHTLLQ